MRQVFNFYYSKKREKLSLAELNEKSIRAWVQQLQHLPFGEANQQLFIMLLEVLQLRQSIVFRSELMEVILLPTLNIIRRLENYVHQQEYLKNDARYTQLTDLMYGLRGLLVQNYFRLQQETYDILKTDRVPFWRLHRRKKIKQIFLNSAKIVLESFSSLIYQQHSLDFPYLSNQWKMLHQVYANALHIKMEQYPINTTKTYQLEERDSIFHGFEYLSSTKKPIELPNLDLLYKQIIVFSIICQRQLSTTDIEQLYYFSHEWADSVDLYQSIKDEKKFKYKISLFDDMMPIENNMENGKLKSDLYISLERLVQAISLKYNYTKNISSLLNFRIQQVLLQSHERKYQRYRYFSNLDLYLGFYSASRYLQRNIEQSNKFRYDIIRYHAEVEDKSARGYKAIWLDDVPKNLKLGEYILLKEQSDVESTLGWQSGVIRRVSRMLDGKVELGIELLAQSQMLCEVVIQSVKFLAILMVQHHIEGERWLLVVPAENKIPVNQRVELLIQQKKMQIYVSKALLTTQNFVQSEVRLHHQQDVEILRAIFSEL